MQFLSTPTAPAAGATATILWGTMEIACRITSVTADRVYVALAKSGAAADFAAWQVLVRP